MTFRKTLFTIFYEQFYSKIPYSFGVRIRSKVLKKRIRIMEKGVRISHNVKILGFENLKLEKFVRIANNVIIGGQGGIEIGKYTMVGFQSIILSETHEYKDIKLPYTLQGRYKKKIHIGSNVWIGTRVIILPGVNIGDNCIIGANSVVTKSFPKNCIIGGNPASILKKI